MNHEAMIKDQNTWTFWPFLAMKRDDSDIRKKNLGILIADENYNAAIKNNSEITIYHANLYKIPETFVGVETTKYSSIEAMLLAGWVVD
jgi:hypothetical protein